MTQDSEMAASHDTDGRESRDFYADHDWVFGILKEVLWMLVRPWKWGRKT